MRRDVEAFCRRWELLPPGELALCAVSGGRDSMALLHLLCAMAEGGCFRVAAAHFNHRLRPTADRDQELVRAWCARRDVPLVCGSGDVEAFARQSGKGLEDAARTLRYRFLEETADALGAARIATAHHREDNAETVLLHLLRGSGLGGLGGIAPVRGRIVRPLLEVSRREIDAYISRHQIPWVEDETNADRRFTRNRLRLEVLPLLEELAPGAAERIARTAGLVRAEDAHLRREAEALLPPYEDGRIALPDSLLEGRDEALRRRLVRSAAQGLGVELTQAQTDAALALCSGGQLDLPGGLRAVRSGRRLIFEKKAALPPPLELTGGEQRWGPWRVRLTAGPAPAEERRGVAALSAGPLTIAAWDGTGRLAVENGSRTIKRLFADRGIPAGRRTEYPALYREGRCVAVLGVAVDRAARAAPGEWALIVAIEPLERGKPPWPGSTDMTSRG